MRIFKAYRFESPQGRRSLVKMKIVKIQQTSITAPSIMFSLIASGI
jgi:hypothetical protein